MVDASLQDTVHLAIETTGRLGSIAVLLGQRVLRQTNLDPTRRTAATLAPELDLMLRWCRESNHSPQFVSVADGPGSFTGLRIGVTTAKTLCYALELPLVAVDSLAAIAAAALNNHPGIDSLWVATDAYRGQVFAGAFTRRELLPRLGKTGDKTVVSACDPGHEPAPDRWTAHPSSVRVLSGLEWDSVLRDLPDEAKFAGDAKPFGDLAGHRIERECDAVGVGLLAIRAAAIGAFVEPLSLVPRYLKPSAAEEKAASLRDS